ncbi:MFS transporter [candidate division KSB1 bacterium]|nr:MFS transporter [candidate division KSB1 bacterium]NIR70551.1 MFS transporter [candidate division KSB1 bacterium]NIS27697.1 MFS transporter [candidate division KSB1 bacterium]NIT74528.1 MFS transporter [candidate division KSB1 bacterium]NIU28350.1 MFS transporter [candidate division KSB1 bacterium]
MYDWANSAFSTTVIAAFFPIYFKQYWSQGIETTQSTAVLGVANSIAGLLVAVMAPVIGAIADVGSQKKKFLIFFAYLGVLCTAALFLVHQGEWLLAAIIYVLGSVGFSGSLVFYDSLLPSITDKSKIDYVSGLGYGLGYLGGGILLALNVWMTLSPETFALNDSGQAVKISFLTVAIWWGLFSLPIILFVKEPKRAVSQFETGVVFGGLQQLLQTFRKIRHLKTVFLFLVAYWLYIDGVDTIVRMAVDYGLSIGFERNDLIVALLITQFVGFPCAIFFGRLGEKYGPKRGIFIAIGIYLFVVGWATMMDHKLEFYGLAFTVGLVQGGIQALSRSYYSRIIPHDQSGEFYGFYNLLGKFAVILGPILIGMTGLISKSSRVGIASIAVLFLAGGVLLYFVDEKKGAEEVKYLSLSK